MATPLVSVIVCTLNSDRYLDRCLRSIKEQTYKNLELILVDNYSKDGTLNIAKKYTKKIYLKGPERSYQYNHGVKKSRGKYIYRIDSDFYVDPNVISECVAKCEDNDLQGIAVTNVSDDSLGFWSKVRKLERDCYIDDDEIVAVRFMTKDVFLAIGGFDERMYAGEDYDLHNRFVRAGNKWGRIESKETHLGEVTSIWEFTMQSYRYGKNLPYYMKKHPGIGARQMTPIRAAFLRHAKDIISHPDLALGLIIMNVFKFTAGGIGGIVGYVGQTIHK